MAWYEIGHIRTLSRGVPKRGMWRGTRSFLCNQAEAAGLTLALIDTYFPNLPGNRSAQCVRTDTRWHPWSVPGVALILAHYQTRLKPGQINVYYRSRPQGSTRLDVDLDGKVIVGAAIWSTDQKPSSWHIVAGSNHIPKTAVDIRVETVVYRGQFDAGEVDPYVGTINKKSIRIGDRRYRSGKLRLSAYHANDFFDSNYLDVNYFFTVSPWKDGWNDDLRVQRGEWVVQQIETKDTTGALTGEVRDVLIFDPEVGGLEKRRLCEESNWSRIPNKLLWSQR